MFNRASAIAGKSISCLALATAVLAGTAMPASAQTFTGPNGYQQFVRVSGDPGVIWRASMTLTDSNGNDVYSWSTGTKSGGGQTWWYRAAPGDRLYLTWGNVINGSGSRDVIPGFNTNYCAKSGSWGDSVVIGEHCTPD